MLAVIPLIHLLSVLAFQSPTGTAEVEGGRWHELTQDDSPRPESELPAPYAASRDVVVTPVKDGIRIRATWRVRAMKPGWFSGRLLGTTAEAHIESVRWNGRPAAHTSDREGSVVFGMASKDAVVELVAFIPGDPARKALEVDLLPAVSGQLRVQKTGELEPRLKDRIDDRHLLLHRGRFSTGGGALSLELVDPKTIAARGQRPDLVLARAGIGLTVGEAELRGRAHLVWEIRHGKLESVFFTAAGVGSDLQVEGPNVREWKREGERVVVQLKDPVEDRVDLSLRWSAPVSEATESAHPIPHIEPGQAFRTESSVQLARDGEIEVLPELTAWEAVAASALPEWGQGLVEGTPTASFTRAGNGGGELELLRFVPVEGPPVVVDVAGYQVATSREGRILMRAHYEVRNERASHLIVRPPPGVRIIGAQVGGESALPSHDEGDAWRIPLERSVETVEGLLSFPVEVILMGEADEWARKETRELALPTLDAPVAVSRLTLYLPPGFRSLLEPGDGDVVGSFTEGEGITYGLGVGEVGAGQADALFQEAVDAWLDNDFERAQGRLDELGALGASNENIDKLQSNLQVLRGESTGKKVDVALERRIKEQAKARSGADKAEERKALEEADKLEKAGDYAAAQAEYRRALEYGKRLEMLEQSESVEQSTRNVAYEQSIANLDLEVEKQAKESKRRERRGPRLDTKFKNVPNKRVAKSKQKAPVGASAGISLGGASGSEAPVADPEPLEGGVLSGLEPEAPTISSRSRAKHASVIDVEDLDGVPLTTETSRDFTATVDVSATASKDSLGVDEPAGISLAGTTAAPVEEEEEFEDEPEPMPEPEEMLDVDLRADVMPVMQSAPGVSMRRRVISRRGGAKKRRSVRGGRLFGKGKSTGGDAAARPAAMPAAPPPPPEVAAGPMQAGAGGGGQGQAGEVAGADEMVTVYDFADDDIGGEVLVPEGQMLQPDDALAHWEAEPPPNPNADPNEPPPGNKPAAVERLPDPTAHASAMSVVIPTAGQAVLYQRLLLAEGSTYVVEIEAREPLRKRKYR